ncbi:MAG: hypothetical protein E6Q97_09780 [Desulfurellales bacterium]|nr:MAG: hypothetical protein E6Q97_09780 [Desulfurellales bacterium]
MSAPPEDFTPYDKDAELSVLGSALLHEQAAEYAIAMLSEKDFYFDAHRFVFAAIAEMQRAGEAIDPVTLADRLRLRGKYNVVGYDLLQRLIETVPHAEHVRFYANIVLEFSKRRRIIAATLDASRKAYGGQFEAETILRGLSRAIDDVSGESEQEARSLSRVAASMRDRQSKRRAPIPTGIPDVDAALQGGYRPGTLNVVAARPGAGKTAYGVGAAIGAAEHGDPVLFVSIEMDGEDLAERLQSRGSRRFAELEALPIYFEDKQTELEQICGVIRRTVRRHNIRLAVVDYLGLIEVSSRRQMQPHEKIEQITQKLRSVARQQQIAVMLLAQLNRDLEKRDDKRPRLSDLKSSGAIEQDADIVQFLYRPELYVPTDRPGEADVIIAKQRAYKTGSVKVAYIADETRFAPYTERKVEVSEYAF